MKKLFKRVSILFAALMALSVSTVRTVEEVKAATTEVATFEFGSNGATTHADGSDLGASKSYTDGEYTLALTNMSKVYGSARDAKGNSCLKLGTSSVAATLTFAVPDDVISVVINAAKYKANATTVTINGTSHTLTKNSNDGAYDALSVDTSSTSSITFATTSSTKRCMINSIVFYVDSSSVADKTPEEIATNELSNFTNMEINSLDMAENVYTLPESTDEYTFNYSLEGDTSVFVLEGNVLTVKPNGDEKTATLSATVTCEDYTTEASTKTFRARQTAYTVTEALDEIDTFNATTTTWGEDRRVAGRITKIDGNNYFITDGTNTLQIYGIDNIAQYDLYVGDDITVYGVIGIYVPYSGSPVKEMQYVDIESHTSNMSNLDFIALEETSFSLSFDYDITYEQQESENAYEEQTGKLSFASTAQRVSQTTSQQVWSNDGITLTNDKSSSTSNIVDSSNPVKLYASSKVTIAMDEGYNIAKIVFTANSSSYATALKNSIGTEATASGSTVTYVPTTESSSLVIAKLTAQVRLNSLEVTYKVPTSGMVDVVTDSAFANVGLTFGAKVTSTLFEGYTKVSGGVMIDNAANYTNTTIAEAYANGEFEGITTSKESLKLTDDGFYSVGSTIEVIDGLVDENNKKYLSYEFVAAVYFTLENAEGTTTVVLAQKAYSVSTMVDYYLANSSDLGLNDEAVKVVEAFDAFIG